MKENIINEIKKRIEKNKGVAYPEWLGELIIDVVEKYGKHLDVFDEALYYVWRNSVEFATMPKTNKRNFKQSELDKIVKRHKNFYLGEYMRFDGSCPNTLSFYFKRPDGDC